MIVIVAWEIRSVAAPASPASPETSGGVTGAMAAASESFYASAAKSTPAMAA